MRRLKMNLIPCSVRVALMVISGYHYLQNPYPYLLFANGENNNGSDFMSSYIKTVNNVDGIANIVRDIRDMTHICTQFNPASSNSYIKQVLDIYTKSSPQNNVKDPTTGQTISLQSLSTQIGKKDLNDADYRIDFTQTFQFLGLLGSSSSSNDDGNSELFSNIDEQSLYNSYSFADQYVITTLQNAKTATQCQDAVDAAGILNIWIQAAHQLWESFIQCSLLSTTGYNAQASGFKPQLKADSFLAYWVGSLQMNLDTKDGYSLYSWTQHMGELFQVANPHAYANNDILIAFQNIQSIFNNNNNSCSPQDPNAATSIWFLVHDITRKMMVPIIQNLIHALRQGTSQEVALFSQIFVPQIAQCRPSTYLYLKEKLLGGGYDFATTTATAAAQPASSSYQYVPEEFAELIVQIQSTYECLGLSCSEIGVYKEDTNVKCYDDNMHTPFAGYQPSTWVHEQGKIDLDIHQMDILMKYPSFNTWRLAKLLYMNGKNAKVPIDSYNGDDDYYQSSNTNLADTYTSLYKIATLVDRTTVTPYYSLFEDYFDDPNYANSVITKTFDGNGIWGAKPTWQRRSMIIGTIRSSVMYMHILTKMEDAYSRCTLTDNNNDDDDGDVKKTYDWDQVAAYMIGSMEDSAVGGSSYFHDGKSFWSLGNQRCVEFSRENTKGYAIVNSFLSVLLYAGKGQIESNACDSLRLTIQKIQRMLLVPIIQTIIKYAIVNQYLVFSSPDESVPLGEAYTNSILPILKAWDPSKAVVVRKNMVVSNFNAMVEDGAQYVADSFLGIMDDMGIECEYIGKSFEVNMCLNYKPELRRPDDSGSFSYSNSRNGVRISMALGGLVCIFSYLWS